MQRYTQRKYFAKYKILLVTVPYADARVQLWAHGIYVNLSQRPNIRSLNLKQIILDS